MPFPKPEWIKVSGPELLEGLERGFDGLVPGQSGIYMWKLAVCSLQPLRLLRIVHGPAYWRNEESVDGSSALLEFNEFKVNWTFLISIVLFSACQQCGAVAT